MSEAYVTLATNDGYAIGALVLGHSLRSNNTTRDLCILITPTVTPAIRSLLEGVFNNVVVVDVLDSGDSAHLSLMKRPELGVTFTKLHCWTLTQYSKCVFLDADMLCVQNPDALFSHPELTAVCDVGWPDCFNSGMFVFVPSQDTYSRLLHQAETAGSFDGGDQGLLNNFFPDWHRVSFVYNMVASATYTYLPAYKQYGADAKLVHFLGSMKPWQHRYNSSTGSVDTPSGHQHLAPYLNSWWAIYLRLVQPGVPETDLQNVDVKSPLDDQQGDPLHAATKEVQEYLQTVKTSEEHIEICDSHQVFMEEVKAEPIVHTSERCDSGEVFVREVEDEPHGQSLGVIDSIDDGLCIQSLKVLGNGDNVPSVQSLEVLDNIDHELTSQSLKVPCSFEQPDLCVSLEIEFSKSKDLNATEQSESLKLGTPAETEPEEVAQQLSGLRFAEETLEEGKARWERGEPDYLGKDAFDNILAYIDTKLKSGK